MRLGPIDGSVCAHVESVVTDSFARALSRARTGEGFPAMPADARVRLRMSWNPRRRSSWGGRYATGLGVSLALRGVLPPDDWPLDAAFTFHEYKRIAHRSDIGEFEGLWRDHARALVAHETAHAVQHALLACMREDGWRGEGPFARVEIVRQGHGKAWQVIYRDLRRHLFDAEPARQRPMIGAVVDRQQFNAY